MTNPPMEADFLSHMARGRREPRDPEDLYLWDGVSVYDTENEARAVARQYPRIGAYIAPLDVLEGGTISYAKTGRSARHYTLWGAAGDMLRCVELALVKPV